MQEIKMRIQMVLIILAALFFTSSIAFSQQELERMDNSMFAKTVRAAAVFSHDEHNETAELEDDCSVCHHVYEGKKLVAEESSEDSMCSECHELKATNENGIPLEVAYHKRCRSCHFDTNKGPVLCGECHKKE
ncbi:MAG: cytochrome c3 family protein [Desulfobacteraceae bacterium]|nr:cytochrome c3 family protein [Desulfobacteraceae bacterium]